MPAFIDIALPVVDGFAAVKRGKGQLAKLLRRNQLYCVFQPIARLEDGVVYAHEALIRGPGDSSFHTPDVLLLAASHENLNFEFEVYCVFRAIKRWGRMQQKGRLFVNISADVLLQAVNQFGSAFLLALLAVHNILARTLVLEITEYQRVADMNLLAQALGDIRAAGVALALDDFGDGCSSLRLWSHLKPEFVKIDKYFIHAICQSADKLNTIQALKQIAAIFGSTLVAEGIETGDELRVLRDLGIGYGQGFHLGRPHRLPRAQIHAHALALLADRAVAVFPEQGRLHAASATNRLTALEAPTVKPHTNNDELALVFFHHPNLHAIAVVDDGRPVAIVNRAAFMNEYSKLYYREIWGHKSCMPHANMQPRLIERNHNVEELIGILTSDDQRYLADGFIVTDNGRYVGLGTGEQLVRSVTEMRIEAARHANPLTFLPGNIPISQHIERLLAAGVRFVACYADLNNFKPFNDQYGYWRGDEMIRLVAKICQSHCNQQRDFLGHVGGDDFIILYQSENWQVRCQQIIDDFAGQAMALFDESARRAGGIEAEDRFGVIRFFPLTTLSIGAVKIAPGQLNNAEQVASLAALAKHDAKIDGKGLVVRVV